MCSLRKILLGSLQVVGMLDHHSVHQANYAMDRYPEGQ